MPGSNRRPLPCEGSALPAAPIARGCLANRTVGHDREVDTSPRDTPDAHRRRPGRVEPGADSSAVRRRCREGRSGSGHARDARTECVRDRPERATWPARFVIRSRHPLESLCRRNSDNADVAQLVAHHLAKVRVASSSLVIRSSAGISFGGSRHVGSNHTRWRGRAARHRPAKPFTRVRIPSPPLR